MKREAEESVALLGFVFHKPKPWKRTGFAGEAEAWRTSEGEQAYVRKEIFPGLCPREERALWGPARMGALF